MSGRRRYEIAPRPAEAGGGWRLRLYDGDDEAGGGVFPPDFLGDDQAEYADAVREGEEWVAGEAEAAGVLILAAARAMKLVDPAHTFALWAVRSQTPPNHPPPSEAEREAFEFVRAMTSGPDGYLATGLRFWDESLEMAENLACCVNEEFGLAPEDAERIARAALRRADTEAGR